MLSVGKGQPCSEAVKIGKLFKLSPFLILTEQFKAPKICSSAVNYTSNPMIEIGIYLVPVVDISHTLNQCLSKRFTGTFVSKFKLDAEITSISQIEREECCSYADTRPFLQLILALYDWTTQFTQFLSYKLANVMGCWNDPGRQEKSQIIL